MGKSDPGRLGDSRGTRGLFCAAGDFNNMKPKVCFYRTMGDTDAFIKHNLVELRHHLAGAEFTKISATRP